MRKTNLKENEKQEEEELKADISSSSKGT